MDKVKRFFNEKIPVSLLASLLSIAIGIVFGFILLICFNPAASLDGFWSILSNGFSSSDKLAKVLFQASPLIFTGLSVAFAFKTGLFNIGATGQYTVGAFCAIYAAVALQLPWYVCLLFSLAGGAVWGLFPGLFKALFNVNEVITSIMFNWIGLYFVNIMYANNTILLASSWGASNSDRTASISSANPDALIPKAGLDKLFGNSSYINISIFIAVLAAVIIYIVLNKTTFGYELKACGYNRDASMYAGINAKRNITVSMVISGALAGLGGGIYYLSGLAQYTLEKSLLAMGFNGIPVALLASSNPAGVIFSAFFVSYINVGGEAMQPEFAKEVIDIIIAAIIYLSAFSLLMKSLIGKHLKGKKERSESVKKETVAK